MSTLPEPRGGPVAAVAPDGIGADGRFHGLPGQSVRTRAARGSLVNGAFLALLNGLGLVKGILIASLLTTGEYGLWGLVMLSLGTLIALSQVGVDDKYLQQDHPDQRVAFQVAFTLQCLLMGAFALLILVAMPLFGVLYGHWEMVGPGIVLALTAPATALQAPLWVHYRRMDYVRQRSLQAADPVVSFAVTVALAVAGLGVWAPVLGLVAGAWATALLAVRSSPYPLRLRYERGSLRDYASFSWPLFATALSFVAMGQVPVLVADHVLGLDAVAAITLALNIALFAHRLDDSMTQALYPAICAVKNRLGLLFEAFSKSNRLAMLWALPCGVGVALFASDFVHLVIGERWRLAVGVIQVFALTAAMNQVGFNFTAFFRAIGRTRPIAVVTGVQLAGTLGIAVPLLASNGLRGFAFGTAVAIALALAVRLWYLAQLFPALGIVAQLWRALVPSAVAAGTILVLRAVVSGDRGPGRVIAEVVAFGVLSAVTTLLVERHLLRESLDYLRRDPVPAGGQVPLAAG